VRTLNELDKAAHKLKSASYCWVRLRSLRARYSALWCGRRFRTFNVVDDFNREVLAIEVDLNLPTARVLRVLERIAAWRAWSSTLRNPASTAAVFVEQGCNGGPV